jgi:UDP-glucose 4-epimerase
MASSSSVYGNAARYPVDESLQPAPISPYAVSKTAAEMYARVFSELYEIDVVALRYFNVFGPRQDPDSAYSAVIPRFITRMRSGLPPRIFGDGRQTRDFTYVDNVVSANIKACFAPGRISGVYNVAGGQPHSLLDLVSGLNQLLNARIKPEHLEARPGDVRQSHADTARAERAFGYRMEVGLTEGLRRTLRYFEAALPLPTADPAPIEAD